MSLVDDPHLRERGFRKHLQVKSVRFTKVVETAGKPEPYTLWQDPDKDPEFHEQRIVGLKYDLLTESKPRGKVVEPTEPERSVVRPARRPLARTAEPEAQIKPSAEPPPPPEPPPKFRVRARVVVTVDAEIEVEAKNKTEASKAAIRQLGQESLDFTSATRQVKVTKVSKT